MASLHSPRLSWRARFFVAWRTLVWGEYPPGEHVTVTADTAQAVAAIESLTGKVNALEASLARVLEQAREMGWSSPLLTNSPIVVNTDSMNVIH
ncbi:MAG: hypothetical protein AB7G11_02610 [Phycisphaerales bacterium]